MFWGVCGWGLVGGEGFLGGISEFGGLEVGFGLFEIWGDYEDVFLRVELVVVGVVRFGGVLGEVFAEYVAFVRAVRISRNGQNELIRRLSRSN